MDSHRTRYDNVSILLHWSIGLAIIGLAAVELLRGEVFPKGSYLREALKTIHEPAGTIVFALILFRLRWRSTHPAPYMPETMHSWERIAAKLTHSALYVLMVAIPLAGIGYVLARGRPIDFGFFQIIYPLDQVISRNTAGVLKNIHEFLGQAVLAVALVHATVAVWHHYVRMDDVLDRMLPIRKTKNVTGGKSR